MYVETFDGGSRYVRLESGDWDKIKGKRIVGEGKITGLTNADGENHPAVIRTDEGSLFTPTELDFAQFDGRHQCVDFGARRALKEERRSDRDTEDDTSERLVTDGGESVDSKCESESVGDETPAFPSEISTFEASVRRNMNKNWSLASDVWRLEDESSDSRLLVTFNHRESISRIQLSTQPPWVDSEVTVDVYRPLSKDEAARGQAEDVNDLTVTTKTFDMMGEAVWFAEYFARTVDERIPENPATMLHGPVEQNGTTRDTDCPISDGGEDPTRHVDDETIEDATESNYDEYHPDWLTVDEARDLLAAIQRSWEAVWDIHMDALENGDLELVAASGDVLVFADHNGTMWGNEFTHGELEDRDLDRAAKRTIKQVHHAVAKQYTDYPWETSDPFVIRKPDSFDAGQRFVEAFINGLRQQGISPGRAWAVYGVHVAGHSRNQWASMNGYSDHSPVSEGLRKVEEKEPYIPVMHA